MTHTESAQLLIEQFPHQTKGLDPKIKALCDRMFLQVFSVPSLLAWLSDVNVEPQADKTVKIQFDFMKLPQEILPDLERLLSVDAFENHRFLRYIKNGQARTGLEITVGPDDLPGDAYSYAY